MKNIFLGYSKKTEDELKELWETSIIFFDTNVLLNLYRYSNSTRVIFLEILNKLNAKIFITYQSALEYNRNRFEVILEQEKTYKEFLKNIKKIEEDLKSKKRPPFFTNNLNRDLEEVFTRVNEEINLNITTFNNYYSIDPIYIEISSLFENKIAEKFSKVDQEEIIKSGEKRYLEKTPPGYEDAKTKKDDRKYGDLLIWQQLLRYSKDNETNIIFVTDDKKEDWWWKLSDEKTIGPRQELIEEFKNFSGKNFHMYSSDNFLKHAQQFLNESINQNAYDEINEINKIDLDRENSIKERINAGEYRSQKLYEEIRLLEIKLDDAKKNIGFLQNEMAIDPADKSLTPHISELNSIAHNIEQKLKFKKSQLSTMEHYLNDFKNRINNNS